MRPNAKLENCIQFAASASVVGDGNNNNSVSVTVVTGLFENALSQFHCKTIIPLPLCVGAFGKVNEDLDRQSHPMSSQRSSININRQGTHNLTTCQHSTRIRKGEQPTILYATTIFDRLLQ